MSRKQYAFNFLVIIGLLALMSTVEVAGSLQVAFLFALANYLFFSEK